MEKGIKGDWVTNLRKDLYRFTGEEGDNRDTYYDMVKWNIDKIHAGMLMINTGTITHLNNTHN